MSRQLRMVGLVGVVLLAGLAVRAEEAPVAVPLPLEMPVLLARGEALTAAAAVTAERYEDADTVLVAGMQRVVYEADGRYEQWHEEYVKVLTEAGRRAHLTLSSHFTIPYQRGPEDCRIPLVELIKPDGRVVPIDVEGQSRIMVDPSSMAQNIYNPNEKIIAVNVAGLEVGDVLHFVMFDRIVQPRMEGSWNGWYVFEGLRPVVRQVVEVRGPAAAPLLSMAVKDPVGETLTFAQREEGETRVYRWEAREVPRAFPEPNMPPLHTVAQRVLVSTSPDWETVSRWYWRLSEPHYATDQAIRDTVAGLVAGAASDAERIRRLFTWVAQEIRYMGIIAESTSPGYEPHDVTETYRARHGVCRDKAALLVVMLREAGIEAFPTLIHNGPRKDPEVPQPFFNHAIVAARDGDGYILMDPTDETSKALLPGYLDNQSYLVATPEGDPLRVSPITPASENLVRIETRGTLQADGRLAARSVLHFEGVNDNAYRQYFAQTRADDRRRLFESVVKSAVPTARVTALTLRPENLLDTAVPLEVVLTFEAEDVLVWGPDMAVLPLPVMGTRVGMVNFILGRTGLRERRYPFMTEMACGIHEDVKIALPEAFGESIRLPSTTPVATNTHLWTFTSRQEGTNLTAVVDFRLQSVEFSPAEYGVLKQTLEEIERTYRKVAVYRVADTGEASPAPELLEGSDVLIEDDTLVIDVTGPGAWTTTRDVRLRILTYGGKKAFSEIKVDYMPAWEEVRLERGEVVSSAGVVAEIRPGEINLMHAPWVGGAPRYPAGKTLVASLPAVEIGSVVAYRIVRESRGMPCFAARESLQALNAIGRRSIVLRGNRAGIRVVSNNMERVAGVLTEEHGPEESRWTIRSVPAIPTEDDQPPLWAFAPTLFFADGTWPAYAATLSAGLEAAARGQARATARARELVRGVQDPWEQVRVLRDFVAGNVRDAGPGLTELPLEAISPADRTLEDGYGNTSDRAVLLVAMLRAVGFKPSLVAVASQPGAAVFGGLMDRVVDRAWFDQVLVRLEDRRLKLPADQQLYLGEPETYARYAPLGASHFEGSWGLRLPGGTLDVIRPVKPTSLQVIREITFDEGGQARMRVRQRLYGSHFAVQNRLFTELPPEERRRYLLEMAAEVSQAARPIGPLVTDFSGYPGEVQFELQVDGYGVRDGDALYFDLPLRSAAMLRLRADARRTPLLIPAVWQETHETQVTVPGVAQALLLPPPLDVRQPGVEFRQEVEAAVPGASEAVGATGGAAVAEGAAEGAAVWRLTAGAELRWHPVLVAPEAYPALLQGYRELLHRRTRLVFLSMVAPAEVRP